MPNKFDKSMIVYFLQRGKCTPFAHNNRVNLIKTQISSGYCVGQPIILEICLATIEVCVFCALALVDALFIFGGIVMKKLLSIVLTLFVLLAAIPLADISVSAATSGTTGDCTWTLDDTVLTISGNGNMDDYSSSNKSPWGTSITEVIIEYGVTSIGKYAFYGCSSLKGITFPNSIKSFGTYAFYSCSSLPGIIIPDGATYIGSDAFSLCSKIKDIAIPESVTFIDTDAFSFCPSLTSLKVDKNNTIYYSSNNCIIEKSTNVLVAGCKTSVIPDGVVSIGEHAFSGNDLIDTTIPDSVTSIGWFAFSACDFASIALPKSITDIDYGAFYLCSNLTDVYYSGNRVDKSKINIGGGNEKLTAAHWHYAPCENDAHTYDYDCTTACKNCDYIRVADMEHTFDNDCDEVCNICGAHRKAKHIFEQLGENTATCKNCNLSKTFDFIITTDETITLSYEATKEFEFLIEDTSIAKITNVSNSIVSAGSYYKQVSSAKVVSVFPGETVVKIVATNGTVLTTASLLVVEGEHQMQLSKVLEEATCTEHGKELHICKFCDYEEEKNVPALGHTEVVDAAVAPTCTKTGLTEGKHCSVCNTVLVAQEVVPETGEHIWNGGSVDNEGNIHYECDTCDATRSKKLLSIAITTLPEKLIYIAGEHDITCEGMEITAYYDDDTSYIITSDYSVSWGGPFEPPSVTVTVKHRSKSVSFEATVIMLGDCNSDGKVDTTDLAIMKLFLAGAGELSDTGKLGGDLSGDGKVDTTDLAMLKLKLAGNE